MNSYRASGVPSTSATLSPRRCKCSRRPGLYRCTAFTTPCRSPTAPASDSVPASSAPSAWELLDRRAIQSMHCNAPSTNLCADALCHTCCWFTHEMHCNAPSEHRCANALPHTRSAGIHMPCIAMHQVRFDVPTRCLIPPAGLRKKMHHERCFVVMATPVLTALQCAQ